MFQLVVYVPETHLEPVKAALFAAGAGRIGDYAQCSWQVLGQGQFLPRAGAQPFIGTVGAVERLPEWRLELVVGNDCIDAVLAALRQAHPYEEPAFHAFRVDYS